MCSGRRAMLQQEIWPRQNPFEPQKENECARFEASLSECDLRSVSLFFTAHIPYTRAHQQQHQSTSGTCVFDSSLQTPPHKSSVSFSRQTSFLTSIIQSIQQPSQDDHSFNHHSKHCWPRFQPVFLQLPTHVHSAQPRHQHPNKHKARQNTDFADPSLTGKHARWRGDVEQ